MMPTIADVLMAALTYQERPLPSALPMVHLEACRIELTRQSAPGDFVRTVVYRASVNKNGAIDR